MDCWEVADLWKMALEGHLTRDLFLLLLSASWLHGVSHAAPLSSACYRQRTKEQLNGTSASETGSQKNPSSYRWFSQVSVRGKR